MVASAGPATAIGTAILKAVGIDHDLEDSIHDPIVMDFNVKSRIGTSPYLEIDFISLTLSDASQSPYVHIVNVSGLHLLIRAVTNCRCDSQGNGSSRGDTLSHRKTKRWGSGNGECDGEPANSSLLTLDFQSVRIAS
jgi:hypothetical protein